MTIGEYRIRAFVVVVPELPQRTAFIQEHFKQVGVEAEEFNGVSARESGLVTTHTYDLDNPGTNHRIGAKGTATWMSFYMLWSALNLLPEQYFLTLEWDAKFDIDWLAKAAQALRDVPADFDLLYLGSCCCGEKPTRHIKGDVYEVQYPMCGHATIVAKKALPIMLETQRKVYAPLDISLALHTLPLLKQYVVLPRIVSQWDTNLAI